MPKISIIIPAYNCGKFIVPCLDSLMAQTERDWEAIIIDDGSTDRTRQIADERAMSDPRFRVISQANSGRPSVARNAGLRLATGELLCFLDGDDLYDERKLARQIAVMEAYPDVACVFHEVRFIDAAGRKMAGTYLGDVAYLEKARNYLIASGNRVYLGSPDFYCFMSTEITGMHTSAVMIRRSAVDAQELYFSEDLIIGEDDDLWFRVAKGRKVAFIDEELSYYRQHEASITRQYEQALLGSIATHTRNLERAQHDLSSKQAKCYRSRIARQYRYLGYFNFREGKVAEARSAYGQSLGLDFHWPVLVGLAKTFFPRWLVNAYRRHA